MANCRQIRGITRKNHTTITRHQEGKQSKAISSLFPIKMIAKLEWTQSNTQQNIEQFQNPTMKVTINNESTTNQQQQNHRLKMDSHWGGVNAFYWYQVFALGSVVITDSLTLKLEIDLSD